MKLMSSSQCSELPVQQRSRWFRSIRAVAAISITTLSGWAQNAVTTFAGSGSAGSTNGTGTAASFQFSNPSGVAVDAAGNLYIADALNHVIRKVTSAGVVTTYAGTGSSGSTDNATATSASFNRPQGIAIDGAGNLYVADSNNHTIRRITSAGVVSTLAGTAGSAGTTNGTGTAARFNTPLGIAADRAGSGGAAINIWVADTQNHTIRQIVVATGVVTTLAGTSGNSGTTNGTGAAALFNHPDGIVSNAGGTTLYVADTFNHLIRQITVSSGTVVTLAGSGTAGATDATGTSATFNNPQGLALDTTETNVLVADTFSQVIRSVAISSGVVTTIAGQANTSGSTNGLSSSARFNFPSAVVRDASTNSTYVIDTNNQLIRRLTAAVAPAITSQPTNATVAAAGTTTFTAAASGNPAVSYQWQIQPSGGSSFSNLSASSVYSGVTSATLTLTGVTSAMNGDKFQVVASNGVGSAATSSSATLTVTQPPVFTSAASASFTAGQSGSFTVVATGSPTPTYSTGTLPSFVGFNTQTGVLTVNASAGDASSTAYTFTVTATNSAGSSNQSFSLTVLPPNSTPTITSQPSHYTVPSGTTSVSGIFSVTATANPAVTAYQWQKRQSDLSFGNLSNDGIYSNVTTSSLSIASISPAMNGDVFRVVVSNSVGSTTSAEVTLSVAQLPAFTSLFSTTFVVGQSNSFTFTATGVPAPTFSVAGSLPSGVSLAGAALIGTPSSGDVNTYGLTISATNSSGTVTQSFTLNVSLAQAAAAISTHPTSSTVELGANVTFTGAATGTPTPTLRWQRQPAGTTGFVDLSDDGTYSGTTSTTLTVSAVAAGMTGDQFRLVATNTVDSVNNTATSNIATLTVNVGTSITTFAGGAGLTGSNDGTGTAARFNTPSSIAIDGSGNFYVADAANHVIRKINSAGVVTTLAGTVGVGGSTDGVGTAARFSGPSAVAVNSVGTVYVADTFNHTIRSISPDGTVTTVAGLAGNPGSTDGTGNAARFSFPAGVAIDSSANVYVSDTSNHTIRRITSGGVVTTFAGSPGSAGSTNSTGTAARFNYPNQIAVAATGVLFVADSYNHVIRRITAAAEVTTLAGSAGVAGSADGNGTAARFNQPAGVAVDSAGVVYVADTYSNTIRKISTGGDVTTLAGSAGASGIADGVGAAARFNNPFAISVDTNSNVYIADTRNHTIRRSGTTTAPSISTQPANRGAPAGGSVTFTVVATGTPSPSYQWQRLGVGDSVFSNLSNNAIYSGVTTATLTVSNILSSNSGDQFRVIVTNGVSPAATSSTAVLTIGEPPVFTSAGNTAFKALEAGTFTVVATANPAATFTATDLPSWLTLTTNGVLSGTPPESAVGTVNFTINATNGVTVSQSFSLTVTPAVIAPAIAVQPANVAVDQGQTATFTVTATGTAPMAYQWRRNGAALVGATSSSLTLANAQPSAAGTYTVTVTNTAGSVTSAGATLTVNTAPVFTSQPQTQTAFAGSVVTFSVSVSGGTAFNYQWRKNGVAIGGANASSLTLTGVTAADAGNYDVLVGNSLGNVASSIAQLTIATTASAPVITAQPASRSVLAGSGTVLAVGATGAPTPQYQWRKDGQPISGAVSPTYTLGSVSGASAGRYDVIVSNSAGSVLSAGAVVTVLARSYAGTYFGEFSGGLGRFAIFVREDNTGVFLGYLPGSTAPVVSLGLTVGDNGGFNFNQASVSSDPTLSAAAGEPGRAAALSAVSVSGSIAADGAVTGSILGGANASLSATRAPDSGATQAVAGFYQAGSGSSAAVSYVVAGANGQAFLLTQSGTTSDGGSGSVTATGAVSVVTNRTVVAATIAASGTISGTATGAVNSTFNGGSDAAVARQRLVNISSRARVAGGDNVAIAGFVISGEQSKPVLIRAVGPTLGAAPFNVAGALASPRLELYRGQTSLAVNTGIAGDRIAIDAAGQQAGAFALNSTGADAALLTTLAPGNYTAVVSSTTGTAGVALVEVYDLSAAAAGQKLLNIATRASAGTADATLIAGFVVPPGPAKRVLVRGVGPGLTAFGVSGAIAQPTLILLSGSSTVAQNTNWLTSADRDAISATSSQVGAFGLSANDSALVATLQPGNYTAQIVGAGGATGVALIEVYELP